MRRAAPLSAKLVEQTFDVVEVGSRAGLILGLSLANLRQEELASQQCQLLLVAFVAVRVDDVRGPPRSLEDDRRLVACLDLVDDIGYALSELGDRYRLHDGTRYIRVYRCQLVASIASISRTLAAAASSRG